MRAFFLEIIWEKSKKIFNVSKFVEQIDENRYSVQMSRYKKNKEVDVASILPTLIREKGWERQFDLHTLFSR